jgi:hypothetical protein
MLRRLLPTALAFAGALSLSSCLDYDEELTIHNDLSGEVSVVLTLPDTLNTKYDQVGKELERSKIEKRLANASGVQLVRYERTEGTRQPKITMVFKFSSLDKLNDAIAANPPASIWGGQFAIKKEGDFITVDRKMGVGNAGVEMPEYNNVLYKTHYDGKITSTNSPQYNSPAKDVRYRYKLTEMMARQPTQTTTFAKGWPWLLILGSLAAIGGAAWYGWEYFGKQKPIDPLSRPPSPPRPPQPRRPGPPPQR